MIISQEFMKLEGFEFDVSDAIPGNIRNISFLLFLFFVNFIEKEVFFHKDKVLNNQRCLTVSNLTSANDEYN